MKSFKKISHINIHPWFNLIQELSFLHALLKVHYCGFGMFRCNFKLSLVKSGYCCKYFLLLGHNTYTWKVGIARSLMTWLFVIKDLIFTLNFGFGFQISLINLVNNFTLSNWARKRNKGERIQKSYKFLKAYICIYLIYLYPHSVSLENLD